MPADPDDAGAPQGLSWSWELDFGALARCLGDDGSLDGDPGDEEAAQQAVLAAVAEHGGDRLPTGTLAGMVAEQLSPGPDLAAWLALVPAADLRDRDLAATAGSWRRIASWAQARELAAVAQIASRSAARDKDIGTGSDGRPARVPPSAVAEVSLELTMSQCGASWWTDLAVDLAWRLAATGAELAAGRIDLARARLIAEATRMLTDEAARAVEEKVLPTAGDKTNSALRAALRREVIIADPEGAEERRKQAERQAKVSLYPDEESTATLAGQRLPAIHAAAAMARITAMARAWKASGAGGPIDLLRARVYLGLLLGTMPLIPPAEGGPPDRPDDGPAENPPAENPPAETRRPRTRRVTTCHRPETRTRPATTRITRAPMTARPGTARTARATTDSAAMAPARTMMMSGQASARCQPGRMFPLASRPRSPRPGTSRRGAGVRRPAGCSTFPCPGRPWPEFPPSPAGSAASGRSARPRRSGSRTSPPATRPPNGGSS